MKILYVCFANRARSRTAAAIMREHYPQHEHQSAGMSKYKVEQTKKEFPDAQCVSKKLLDWADKIIVMERQFIDEITLRFGKDYMIKLWCLDCPDIYFPMDEQFIEKEVPKLKILLESTF